MGRIRIKDGGSDSGKDKGGDDGSGLVGEKVEIGSRKKVRGNRFFKQYILAVYI